MAHERAVSAITLPERGSTSGMDGALGVGKEKRERDIFPAEKKRNNWFSVEE